MRGVVQRIFRDHFAAYAASRKLSVREQRAAWSIMQCRSGALGIHVSACPDGHETRIHGNSCRHRSCPLCGFAETQRWLLRVSALLPRCAFYHIVFTVPHELDVLWRYNRAVFMQTYFREAWATLRELYEQELGGLPGVIGTFQSWRDTLQRHLHLHFIATGGALDVAGRWRTPRHAFLFPSREAAKRFRLRFTAALRRAPLSLPPDWGHEQVDTLLRRIERKRWHVEILPPYRHGQGVAKYLARYIKCGPIGESRILRYDGTHVLIARKKGGPPVRLSGHEFISRFLEHAPAYGAHIVRSYGLFHHAQRGKLDNVRDACGQAPVEPAEAPTWQELCASTPGCPPPVCSVCGKTLLTVAVVRYGLSPPTLQEIAHAA